jgi:hypothetical protein
MIDFCDDTKPLLAVDGTIRRRCGGPGCHRMGRDAERKS